MKILIVCLGNICRSPIAHGILQRFSDERNLNWVVDSAGTGNWHVGEPPDNRAISVAGQFGTDISRQRAQHFSAGHFQDYDIILTMDRSNFRNVISLARTDEDKQKVRLFLVEDEVPDPYYDNDMFESVYRLIEGRCLELIDEFAIEL